jgi:prepilin-type N-terminal cleavage/methylation domain-containing protein
MAARGHRTRRRTFAAGFTFIELLVALSLLAAVSVFILQAFVSGMAYAGRSNERAAATTLALQVMEQIRGSVNPYAMVNIINLPRTPVQSSPPCLPDPYSRVCNPTPHAFQLAVTVVQNGDLTLATAAVDIYRPADVTPYVSLTTVLDDK